MKKLFIAFSLIMGLGLVTPSLALAQSPKPNGIFKQILNRANARAAIGSGTISSKASNQLVITKDGKSYTILIDDKTKLRRRFWGKSNLDEYQVGDTVNVIGKWTNEDHTTIQATLIRDLSIQKRFGVFFGTVSQITSNGWIMTTVSRGNQTVTISSSTKLINRKEEAITLVDIKVGDKVRVRGMWDKTASTITEVTQVKSFSK